MVELRVQPTQAEFRAPSFYPTSVVRKDFSARLRAVKALLRR